MNKEINIKQLQTVIDCLLDDKTGCQWDLAQTHETLTKYTLEETYELLYAVSQKDADNTKEELGDLLFHIFFYAKIAEKNNQYNIQDIINDICKKMIERHPHIFEDKINLSAKEQEDNWRALKNKQQATDSFFAADKIAYLPAILQSIYLQKEMSHSDFDWQTANPVFDKVEEELSELKEALPHKENSFEEYGDLLFSVINLARKLKIDPEQALIAANIKFKNRCDKMLTLSESKESFKLLTEQQKNHLWQQVKLKKN